MSGNLWTADGAVSYNLDNPGGNDPPGTERTTTTMPATFTENLIKVTTGVAIGFAIGVPTGALINAHDDITVPSRPSVTVTHAAEGEPFLPQYLHDLSYGPRPTATPTTWQELILAPADRITEDDPRWDCTMMGDHQCGPNNANGVPAGCYDDGGVLVAAWPCTPWTPADGYRHADGTVTK